MPIARRHPRTVAALAAALVLIGCNRGGPPKGQVVATVNGEDITRRDLQAELAAANLPRGTDVKAISPLAVRQLVDRRLLVEEARKEGIDKSPQFLANEQRVRELLLAGMLVDKWAANRTRPTQDEIQRFIADNPQMFGDRRILGIEQVRMPAAGIDQKAFAPMTSMDQITAYLDGRKQRYQRARTTVDTATLTPAVFAQIEALPPGMPFIVSEGGTLVANVVAQQTPQPAPQAQWTPAALAAMAAQDRQKTLTDQLNGLKSGAKIAYQPGFAPPPAAPAQPAR